MGLIYVDACLLIYAFEDHPRHGARVRRRLAAVPPDTLAISPLVRLECLVGPMKAGSLVLQRHHEEGLHKLLSLPLPETALLQAARARAHCGVKTPNAIHWRQRSTTAALPCNPTTTTWRRLPTGWPSMCWGTPELRETGTLRPPR